MKTILVITLLMVSALLWGGWDWANSFGGNGMSRIWDITSDPQNNIFVAGDFSESLVVQGSTFPGIGLTDSFVAKFNSSGSLIWAHSYGSTDEDVALGVGVDAAGNCYLGGYFIGSISFQGQSLNSYGMWDAYLIKLDPEGNLIWIRSFGGPMNDIGYGLAVNPSGQIFIAGWYADTIKFPGGVSISSYGGSDVFCCSYSTDGDFLWARGAGTTGVDYGYEVACDNSGNSYVTGVASPGSQFGNFTLPTGGMFVVKYNSLGAEQWLASSINTAVINIAVQPEVSGSQFGMVAGRIAGAGSLGSFSFESVNGTDDAYWAAFDANTGTWINMQHYGGTLADKGKDADCEFTPAYVANYEGSVSFNGTAFSSAGESDVILGYGALNNLQFTSAGGENIEVSTCVKTLSNGCIAVSGWHFGLSQFGSHSIDSGNVSDQNAFLVLFNPASPVQDEFLPVANRFSLSPNPFHEKLQISLDKANSPEQLDIYNLKGQLVRSLKHSERKSDSAVYTWDGKDALGKRLPAGIYLLRNGKLTGKTLKL